MASDRSTSFRLNAASPLANGLVFAGLGQSPGLLSCLDTSPRQANGTLVNYTGAGNLPADRWRWGGVFRRFALSGAGSDYNVTTGQSVTFSVPATGTVSTYAAWVNLLSNWATIATDGCMLFGGPAGHWALYLDAGYYLHFARDGTNDALAPPLPNTIPGSWHHLAVTRRGAAVQFYLDGKPQSLERNGWTAGAAGPTLTRIGAYGDGSYGIPGSWADPMIWTRDLSAGEVAALADPSNVELRSGGVPLIRPARRPWPVAGTAPPTAYNFWYASRGAMLG